MSTDIFYSSIELFQLVICVGYPSWRSYKVVEAKKFDSEMLLWLSFWLVYSSVLKAEDALEYIVPQVLHGYTYRLLRILFFAWLIHPHYQGALVVYYEWLAKWFRQYHS